VYWKEEKAKQLERKTINELQLLLLNRFIKRALNYEDKVHSIKNRIKQVGCYRVKIFKTKMFQVRINMQLEKTTLN